MAKNPSFWRNSWLLAWIKSVNDPRNQKAHRRNRGRVRRPFERLEDRSMLAVTVTLDSTNFLADDPDIVIVGSGFSPIVANNSVSFSDGAIGTVIAATETELTVEFTVPPEAGNLTVEVTSDGDSSGTPVQVATVVPVVTLSAANLAGNANEITILGSGFDTTFANNSVTFTNGALGSVTASTATSLTVSLSTPPTTAGDLAATVTTNGVASLAPIKVATVVPAVTTSSVDLAADASTLTIAGFGFDTTNTNNTVTFSNGAVGTVDAAGLTATSMTVSFSVSPKTAGDLTVIVSSNGKTSGAAVKVATVSPVATVSTNDLPANSSSITIAGFGFDVIAANNSVTFNNGAEGTVVSATATSLSVLFSTRPTTFGSLTAEITSNGVTSSAVAQVATVVPSVTANPTFRLAVNAPFVVINGFGFDGTTPGNNTVVLNNGAVGAVTEATATTLKVTFSTRPSVAGSLTAVVTTNTTLSSGAPVQIASATPVVSVNAGNTLGGNATQVFIVGSGFSTTPGNNTVAFSSGAVGTVTAATAIRLTVEFDSTGKPIAGPLNAVVTTNGVNNGSAVQVARVRPIVTASSTSLAANAGTLTISGFAFDPTAANNAITFNNGASGVVTAATSTSLTVNLTTKPTTAGNLTAVVTVTDPVSGTSVNSGATVNVANITPVITSSISTVSINATTVTISGFGFDDVEARNIVAFDNGAIGTVTNATPTSLTVSFSKNPTSAGSLSASVTSNSVASGSAVQVATVRPVVTANNAYKITADATSVTINGLGFSTTALNNTVVFNNGAVGVVDSSTPTSLTVNFSTKPTSAGDLTAIVTTNSASSSVAVKVATVAPVVTSSASNLTADEETIVISGVGFDPVAANNTVAFSNGATDTVTTATASTLTVTFDDKPTSVGAMTAVVTSNSISSGTAVAVATVKPTVTTAIASLAINATQIVIAGLGFSSTAGNNTVVFNNGAVGTVTSASPTSLTVAITVKPTAVGDLTAEVITNTHSSGTPIKVATVVPVVTAVTANLAADATLTINGFGFDTTLANNTVEFSSGVGTVTAATANTLTVTFPTTKPTAGNLTAVVTVSDVENVAAVQVATITPAATPSTTDLAADATTITINGFGFDTTASNNTVVFNNNAIGLVTLATATSLTVAFTSKPTTAGSLTATVTSNTISGEPLVQVADVAPVVTSSTANLAIDSSTIVISGLGFDTTASNNTIVFNNDAVGTVVTATATALTVSFSTKPTSLGSLTATVTTNSIVSATNVQVATVAPVVTTSTTDLLANAETLAISGFGFDTTPGNNTVVLSNGAIGAVTAATATTLTVTFTTKPKSGNLNASVVTNGISSAAIQVASVKPVVTSSSASLAANAATITINGFGFDTTLANNTVAFSNDAEGTVTAATATSLTVTLNMAPTALGSLTAIVTTNGNVSGNAGVQVATVKPAVVRSTATRALASNSITISGAGFDTTAENNSVVFNNGAIGTVLTATSTLLTVSLSTRPSAGNLTAVVTTGGHSSGTAVQVATLLPIVTLSTTATLAPDATTLFINGSGFSTTAANNTVVLSNGAIGTVSSATATRLTVSLSKKPVAGNLTARVTTNGVQNASAVQIATVSPKVTSSTASQGLNGTRLVIRGFGFDTTAANNSVVFTGAGGAVGNVTAATANSLTVTFATRPTVLGDLSAVVTTNSRTSGTAVKVATVVAAVTTPVVVTASTTSRAANVASTLTISGSGFSATSGDNVVTFNNGAIGSVTASTATSLTVTFSTLPKAGALTAVVATKGVLNGTAVQVSSITPVVTSNTADLPASANTLTINGFGFDTVAANNRVAFTNGARGTVTSATATTLTVLITGRPTSLGSMNAVVTTNARASSVAPGIQVATVKPSVTSSTVGIGMDAATVVINGFGFSTTPINNTVTFNNGAAGSVTSATATRLTVTFGTNPTALGSLTATVAVGDHSTAAPVQVATVSPTVTSSTTSIPPSTATITINGIGFDATASNNTVAFNSGAAGVVTAATTTSLTVAFAVKPAAGNLTAVVTTHGTSSGTPVQVAAVEMSVTSSTANLAANAATMTINGTGFSTIAANNTVSLSNGALGTVTAATATSLTVTFTSLPNAGDLMASVTTNGLSSGSPVQVATVNPIVTSGSPDLGLNGTKLVINGFGFDPILANNSVVFNDGAIGTVTAASKTSLTVTFSTQPTTLGSLTAAVTTNSRSSGTQVQVAEVVAAVSAPVVTINTTSRAANSNATLTIAGTGFSTTPENNVVTFNNGAIGTVTASSATSLTVTLSTLPKAGNLTAVVTSSGVTSGTAVQVAKITPVVTSRTANVSAGATTITITGVGFDTTAANNRVTFNNGARGTVTSATATSLTVTLLNPKPTAGSLTAIVTTNLAASGSAGIQVARITPSVTARTTSLARTANTIVINGAGFSTTAANNTVVFNNGAVGRVTAATATQLTVTFDTKPVAAGSLTAVITTNSVASGTAVQVATMT